MAPPLEISIPSTSVSESSSKPFTLYNITVRLPLRSYVIQKRYSDFPTLHETLTSQAGEAPPASLPSKHWFKSTVSSADLTQERQHGLEAYLRAIAESPDRRWRDTPAWRAFFNLPASSAPSSAVSAQGRVSARGAAAEPGAWLDQHREMKGCLHEARLCLSRRDAAAESNNTTAAAEAGTAAKRALVKAGTTIALLADGLKHMQEEGRLGEGELRRRRDLLAGARVEREGLERLCNTVVSSKQANGASGGQRSALLPSSSSSSSIARPGRRVIGAPLPETNKTRELDNNGMLMLQKQEMQDQDEQVEQLAAIIRRQKQMGLDIRDEVELQTEMLKALNEDVDVVGAKVKVAGNRLKKL